ncbi:variant SH3 domain-containing protein [Microdochium nivale]|nr:variant SH3 domain-containing protein [Microdochium nivale]
MADEVERLITAPFREIVEKGTIAVENSKDAAEDVGRAMLKAAQGLIKEGDRALKKMEPLCETHLADYGTNFVIAIKESEDISQFRYDLENLLWEFDDYIETDGFEASKFEELQGASRNAAPRILHILKRMRLTAPEPSSRPVSDIASRSGGARSVAASDNLPIGLIIGSPSPMPLESPVHVEARPEIFFGAVAGPDEGLEGSPVTRPSEVSGGSLTTGHGFPAPMNGPPAGPPPPPPSTNPWDLGKAPITTSDVQYPLEVLPHRRAPVSESPILHAVGSRGNLLDSFSTTRLDDTANQPGEEEDEQRLRAASQSIAAPSEASRSPDTLSQRWTNSTQGSYEPSSPLRYDSYPFNDFSRVSRTISNGTEHSYVSAQPYGQRMSFASSEAGPLAGPPLPGPNRASALVPDSHSGTMSPTSPFQQDPNKGEYRFRQNSTDSVNSSVLDVLDFPNSPTHTLRYGPRKSSLPASMNHGYPPTAATRASLPAGPVLYEDMYVGSPRGSDTRSTAHASSSTISHSAGLEVVRYPSSVEEKILVESDEYTSGFNRAMPIRQFDCSIGPHSSFYRLKGFCKGAEDMMKGNVNTFKKTKRPVGGFAMSIVGKCPSCHFELDWKRVENDLQGDEMGNYVASGIGYRVRALQKCHLASKSIEESLFACPFCIQLGKTMEESDSTVFMSQKDFLVHLSRHPRPLPMVSGLTVIEDEEIPPEQRYSFDLHFFSPTVQSVMTGIIPEIARLPTAIATETKKAIFGMSRNTPDRAPVLQFATGARIVGIEFPEKYNGRWAIGWHDGTRGAFETDAVQIDAPPKDEVRMRGDSSLQAVAKWRWNQKSDDKWLKFDKGEVIKNISWVYDDHWCWSGQNSKGSAGILPASHIDRHSLKSIQPGDSASSGSEKKRTHLFGLSRTSDLSFPSFLTRSDSKHGLTKVPSSTHG